VAPPLPLALEPYFLPWRGEWNVPQKFLKATYWKPATRNRGTIPDGTPGYFTQLFYDNPDSLYPIKFNFDLISWVDVQYSHTNSKWIVY